MKASRWFKLGSYGLLLMAVLHFVSNWSGLPIKVDDSAGRELLHLMANYEIDFFGLHRTMDATIKGFIITWGAMLSGFGIINLSVAGLHPGSEPPASFRWANAVIWVICLIVAIVFWSWPQIILFAGIAGAFVMALLPAKDPHSKQTKGAKKQPRVAIVGAGAAGLTAAWSLNKNGYDNVTVFEKSDRVGGKCETIEVDNHAIDLAAHEMLAGYTDVMRIASDVGAPSHGWQDVIVYNREQREYLSIMGASTASGYSKLQVGWASIRYTWLLMTRYRRFSKPGTGLADAPSELHQPVATWLKEMKLEPLAEIVLFVMTVQGYGRLDQVAAAYFVKFQGFRNWVSNVLHNVGIVHYWPRVFTDGFQDLWERVAAKVGNVQLSNEIESIRRDYEPDGEVIGVEIKVKGKKPQYFDKLILTCPHDLATLGAMGLDIDEQEKSLFSKIRFNTFVTTACRVEGIPTGVVGTIPLPSVLDYTGYIKVYADCDVVIFYSLALEPNPDLEDIYQRIVKSVEALPNTLGQQPKVIEKVKQQAWQYFPHPSISDMAAGYFDQLRALQGYRQTYYAGSLLEMETVGNTVANALHTTNTQFPPLN